MKNRNVSVLFACAIAMLWSSVGGAAARNPVTFGSVIRLKHAPTGRYLTATNEHFVHSGSSGQAAVYCGNNGDVPEAQWIVKGNHTGDRWAFSFPWNADVNAVTMSGWPLRMNQTFRLENVATSRNLHSHDNNSPRARDWPHNQKEVTNFGDGGIGDTNCNFKVVFGSGAVNQGGEYLNSGDAAAFRHVNSNRFLHSHDTIYWQEGKQEVTTADYDTKQWIIEVVTTADKNRAIATVWNQDRAVKLSYWTPVFWDTDRFGVAPKSANRRVWVHGASRLDSSQNNTPPNDHCELLVSYWSDWRVRQGPSIFLFENADNKFKTGPIKFGDRVKIVVTHGGAGEPDKDGFFTPFRYVWMGTGASSNSRYGAMFSEPAVSRPDFESTKDNSAIFILEPVIPGQTGEISSTDLVRIKSEATKKYFWTNWESRYDGSGNYHHEILANKDSEDAPYKRHEQYDKFRFSLATDATTDEQVTRTAIANVNKEVQDLLGAEGARQQAIVAAARIAQLEQEKLAAQNATTIAARALDAEKRNAAEQIRLLQAAQAEALRLDNIEDEKKLAALKADLEGKMAAAKSQGEAAFNAAKIAADAALAKANSDAAARLAAANAASEAAMKTATDNLAKEKERAAKELQDTKAAAEKAKQEAADLAAKQLSAVEAKAAAAAMAAATHAAELQHMLDLPVGFGRIAGKAQRLAFGLQDREIEKTIDNKGTKKKVVTFDDFGVIVLDDGSIAQYALGADPANPWQRVVLVDEKGAEVKAATATVGLDGTTFVISQDGKSLYGINWPGDTPAAMPHASKGFAVAEEKAAGRKGAEKRKGAGKGKKGKKGKKAAAGMVDANHDGKDDRDTDGDGKVSAAEEAAYAAAHKATPKKGHGKKGKGKKGKKAAAGMIDANHDGKDDRDTDGDGKVSAAEEAAYAAAHKATPKKGHGKKGKGKKGKHAKMVDANHDGKDDRDTDGDGKVSAAEAAAAHK